MELKEKTRTFQEIADLLWPDNSPKVENNNLSYMSEDRRSQWLSMAEKLYNIQIQRLELEKTEKMLKDQLIELSDHRPQYEGQYILSCSIRSGNINYKAVPELKGLDLEQYRGKEVKTWKLIKIEKE